MPFERQHSIRGLCPLAVLRGQMPLLRLQPHVHHGKFDEDSFVTAYVKEIETTARRAPERLVESIFLAAAPPR